MTDEINPMARKGFQASADAYERGRPDYPAAAIDFLAEVCGIRQGARVIELGAGTGKFTRLLTRTNASFLAIEPVEGMRTKFASLSPEIEIQEGNAERIPSAAEAAEVVLAAQAFHWFNGEKALAEIHRVLKPGGTLGLIWNVRDESIEWVAELTRIIDVYEQGAPRYKTFEWKRAFRDSRLFAPLQHRSFDYRFRCTVGAFMDRIASTSFIASLPEELRESVLQQIRTLIGQHRLTKGQSTIETAYKTDVYWCRKV